MNRVLRMYRHGGSVYLWVDRAVFAKTTLKLGSNERSQSVLSESTGHPKRKLYSRHL